MIITSSSLTIYRSDLARMVIGFLASTISAQPKSAFASHFQRSVGLPEPFEPEQMISSIGLVPGLTRVSS